MARTAGQSKRLKKRFLEHFAQYGNITHAAKATGINRVNVYWWQEHDEEFSQAFKQADIQATEVLEQEARRRAVEGVEKQRRVFDSRGNLIDEYTETSYSDTLLIFLLKARSPEKYRDRHDVTTGGQPINTAIVDLDAAIEQRLAELAARGEGQATLAPAGSAKSSNT